jgi:17beta-estradiol 17-dehydrogenase / very-long-chain 3-oxoacyl-CoA reductase
LYKQLVKLGAVDYLRQKGWFSGNLFEVVGIVVVFATLYKVWAWVYNGFLKRARRPESYGKWAIVTGTTAGIGEAFVHDLARRKMSILIISR